MCAGTAEHNFNWGRGAENSRQRCEFVGGSENILPQKSLKSRGSEVAGIFNILKFRILHPHKSSSAIGIIVIND